MTVDVTRRAVSATELYARKGSLEVDLATDPYAQAADRCRIRPEART